MQLVVDGLEPGTESKMSMKRSEILNMTMDKQCTSLVGKGEFMVVPSFEYFDADIAIS